MKTIYFTYILVLLFVLGIRAKAIENSEDSVNSDVEESDQGEDLLSDNEITEVNMETDIIDMETEVETEIVDTLEAAKKFYDQYENVEKDIVFNGERKLDVYYDPEDTKTKKPVNIYIFGGSWVSNEKTRFTRLGALLEEEGYIGVIPDYILYPNGLFEDMVDDVYKAIQWTYDNIEKYGGDKDNIILTGHSSGAHLVALTVIKAGLGLENNGVKLEPLPSLKRVVLMNGPYIFDQDFITYTLQGSNDTSNASSTDDPQEQNLLSELIGLYFNNDAVSPIAILRGQEKDSIKNNFNVEKFTFVYCSNDIVIPESSAKDLITEITRTSPNQLYEYVYLEGLEHPSIINGIKTEKAEFENLYLDIIRK